MLPKKGLDIPAMRSYLLQKAYGLDAGKWVDQSPGFSLQEIAKPLQKQLDCCSNWGFRKCRGPSGEVSIAGQVQPCSAKDAGSDNIPYAVDFMEARKDVVDSGLCIH